MFFKGYPFIHSFFPLIQSLKDRIIISVNSESYHFIIFRGQLKDTSQLAIHKIIRLRIFPLVEKEKQACYSSAHTASS